MKISKPLSAIVLLATLLFSWSAFAGDLYVIANNASTITSNDVHDIFLGEKQISNNVKLVPIDNASVQKDFFEKIMKMEVLKYNDLWAKKGFRDGINAPATKSSDAEVIAAVKANPGAVGYVSSNPAGVKVITSMTNPVMDVKSCEAPKYPKSSLLNEEAGTVELEFLIAADGKIVDSKVNKSSGAKTLDKAALTAYSLCKFSPAKKDGKPEQSKLAVVHVWKLE